MDIPERDLLGRHCSSHTDRLDRSQVYRLSFGNGFLCCDFQNLPDALGRSIGVLIGADGQKLEDYILLPAWDASPAVAAISICPRLSCGQDTDKSQKVPPRSMAILTPSCATEGILETTDGRLMEEEDGATWRERRANIWSYYHGCIIGMCPS